MESMDRRFWRQKRSCGVYGSWFVNSQVKIKTKLRSVWVSFCGVGCLYMLGFWFGDTSYDGLVVPSSPVLRRDFSQEKLKVEQYSRFFQLVKQLDFTKGFALFFVKFNLKVQYGQILKCFKKPLVVNNRNGVICKNRGQVRSEGCHFRVKFI